MNLLIKLLILGLCSPWARQVNFLMDSIEKTIDSGPLQLLRLTSQFNCWFYWENHWFSTYGVPGSDRSISLLILLRKSLILDLCSSRPDSSIPWRVLLRKPLILDLCSPWAWQVSLDLWSPRAWQVDVRIDSIKKIIDYWRLQLRSGQLNSMKDSIKKIIDFGPLELLGLTSRFPYWFYKKIIDFWLMERQGLTSQFSYGFY